MKTAAMQRADLGRQPRQKAPIPPPRSKLYRCLVADQELANLGREEEDDDVEDDNEDGDDEAAPAKSA